MLIDATNGNVFDGPPGSDPGVSFRPNSSLFVVETGADGSFYPARYYQWKNGKLNVIYQQACHRTDGPQECGCKDVQRLLFEAPN